jgi:integrase
MNNIRFNLNKNKNGSFTIFIVFRYFQSNIKISTKIKIKKKDWDYRLMMPKRSYFAYIELKEYLFNLKSKIEKYLIGVKLYNNIDKFKIKNDLVKILFPGVEDSRELNIFDHFDNFIENKLKDPKRKPLSAKRYISLFRILQRFDNNLSFDKIDLDWYNEWIEWLEELNYSANYINTLTKGLKAFLNNSFEYGITTNLKWKSRRFNYPGKNVDSIYLTIGELYKLYEYKYKDVNIQNAVWLFLLSAFSGLRYGDVVSLGWKKHIFVENNIKMIRIKTSKTGEVVIIPLHPIARYIIDSVKLINYKNQTLNKYIKIAGMQAGINDDIFIEINKGGRSFVRKYKKYEKITSHTARRSFATNAYKAGISAGSIMKITGHKSERQFFEYIKISAEENAITLSNHNFFKMELKRV